MAQAMLHRALHFGPESKTLFSDGMALAFFAHIGQKYRALPGPSWTSSPPWQMRR